MREEQSEYYPHNETQPIIDAIEYNPYADLEYRDDADASEDLVFGSYYDPQAGWVC